MTETLAWPKFTHLLSRLLGPSADFLLKPSCSKYPAESVWQGLHTLRPKHLTPGPDSSQVQEIYQARCFITVACFP